MSGMDGHRWDDDDALLADLGDALREVSPTADRVAQQGRGALVWRTIDTDLLLATLSFDSSAPGASTDRAGETEGRVLVFHAEPLSVELELQADRIVGQILPPAQGEVTLESADGSTVALVTDDLGFFLAPPPSSGAIRLRCETPTARLVTGWFQP